MTTDDQRATWRKEFEQLGAQTVRLRIANPWSAMSDECRREGELWLHDEDVAAEARDDARYRTIRCWTIAAAIAGGIAAATGIITLFR
jgi:hypothetical protein